MRNISTLWTRHLKDQKAKESFELSLRSMYNDPVMKRLIQILKERYEDNNKNRYDYDNQSWAYHQAHINGQQKLIEELKQLLLVDKET